MCEHSTDQAVSRAQNSPGSLPSDSPTVCQGWGITLGPHSLCEAVQWGLKGSHFQPSSKSSSTECRVDRECVPILFPGSGSGSPWTKLRACSGRGPAAELSTAPFSGTRKKSSTPTFQAMFASLPACSLFREGNATALLTHCTSLLQIYFICRAWSTGLEIRGRSKGTVPVLQLAPPPSIRRGLSDRDIESRGRGNTEAVIRNTSNPTNFTQACL